jgi:predicted phosphodiesterase
MELLVSRTQEMLKSQQPPMEKMPGHWLLARMGKRVGFDPLYDYRLTPTISDAELDRLVPDLDADILVVGHTHLPLLRQRRSLQIVDPGSVGQPSDGDRRASCAIWEDGDIHFARMDYHQRPALDAIDGLPCLLPEQRATLSSILSHGRST